jgi:hypothetical protein
MSFKDRGCALADARRGTVPKEVTIVNRDSPSFGGSAAANSFWSRTRL